ncbi:hypothetical protein [Streptomyces altiplanensis]
MRCARILTTAVLLSGLAVGGAGQALADDDPYGLNSTSIGILDQSPTGLPIPAYACDAVVDLEALANTGSGSICPKR